MRHARGGAVVLAALAAPLLLAGCTATIGEVSTITVNYRLDGEDLTVSMHPTVTCGDRSVSGVSIGNGPVGQFSFQHPTLSGDPGQATGGIEAGEGIVLFAADEVILDLDRDGYVSVTSTPVTVSVFEDRESAAPDFDPADAVEATGTLTAELRCDPDT